jgi:hypothetical protein
VINEGSLLVQRTDRSRRNFAGGAVTSASILLLACGVLVPRFAELVALSSAVVGVAVTLAVVGVVLCAARGVRAVGAGVIAGVVLGLTLAWSALVAYVGLLMR